MYQTAMPPVIIIDDNVDRGKATASIVHSVCNDIPYIKLYASAEEYLLRDAKTAGSNAYSMILVTSVNSNLEMMKKAKHHDGFFVGLLDEDEIVENEEMKSLNCILMLPLTKKNFINASTSFNAKSPCSTSISLSPIETEQRSLPVGSVPPAFPEKNDLVRTNRTSVGKINKGFRLGSTDSVIAKLSGSYSDVHGFNQQHGCVRLPDTSMIPELKPHTQSDCLKMPSVVEQSMMDVTPQAKKVVVSDNVSPMPWNNIFGVGRCVVARRFAVNRDGSRCSPGCGIPISPLSNPAKYSHGCTVLKHADSQFLKNCGLTSLSAADFMNCGENVHSHGRVCAHIAESRKHCCLHSTAPQCSYFEDDKENYSDCGNIALEHLLGRGSSTEAFEVLGDAIENGSKQISRYLNLYRSDGVPLSCYVTCTSLKKSIENVHTGVCSGCNGAYYYTEALAVITMRSESSVGNSKYCAVGLLYLLSVKQEIKEKALFKPQHAAKKKNSCAAQSVAESNSVAFGTKQKKSKSSSVLTKRKTIAPAKSKNKKNLKTKSEASTNSNQNILCLDHYSDMYGSNTNFEAYGMDQNFLFLEDDHFDSALYGIGNQYDVDYSIQFHERDRVVPVVEFDYNSDYVFNNEDHDNYVDYDPFENKN